MEFAPKRPYIRIYIQEWSKKSHIRGQYIQSKVSQHIYTKKIAYNISVLYTQAIEITENDHRGPNINLTKALNEQKTLFENIEKTKNDENLRKTLKEKGANVGTKKTHIAAERPNEDMLSIL